MFVGHYAAALAAKAVEPRAPLWALVGGCQLLDIGWSGLVMAGVEKVRIVPGLPGSNLDLYYMPYTHSLPAALVWSAGAAVVARAVRLPWSASAMIGASVFSHWALDFLVHRPDLELAPGGEKVGLAMWNHPLPEMALELGLVGLAGAALVATRKERGRAAWPVLTFMVVLTLVQMIASLLSEGGGGGDPAGFGLQALLVYLAVTAVAWLVDRPLRGASGRDDAVA